MSWSKALQLVILLQVDPPSDLASSVLAIILPTPDGPDPPCDLASSILHE